MGSDGLDPSACDPSPLLQIATLGAPCREDLASWRMACSGTVTCFPISRLRAIYRANVTLIRVPRHAAFPEHMPHGFRLAAPWLWADWVLSHAPRMHHCPDWKDLMGSHQCQVLELLLESRVGHIPPNLFNLT
ncbi:hypothetical protein SRHO_G00185840 [Serrasalmus rhombeus]